VSEEDVEQFLWDVERELRHVDGNRRRELVEEAEERLQEAANRVAAEEDADSLEWYHYVQATAEVGPPERLAAELTGGELPDRSKNHARLWALAGGIVLVLAAIVGWAWWTTGDLEPVGAWGGENPGDASRTLTFNVSDDAESVFLSSEIRPSTPNGTARVTVLDDDLTQVYEGEATFRDPLATSEFVEGTAGEWRIIVDFTGFEGSWNISTQQEKH
jgi:hypothetical protein